MALERIRLLCLDVDGVLTDGGISIDDAGHEQKRFHVRDGAAMRMWARLGHETAVITGRDGMALRHRLRELGVRHVISGSKEKGGAFEALLAEIAGLNAAYRARFVTPRPGGSGAVRDAVEHILKAQNRWTEAVRLFDPGFDPGFEPRFDP